MPVVAERPVPRVGHGRRRVVAVAGGVLVLAIASAAALWSTRGRAPALDRRRVAVLTFQNAAGDPALDPLGRLAADHVIRGIAQLGRVEPVHVDIARGDWDALSRDGPAGVARYLADRGAASRVVLGSYLPVGDGVELRARVVDVASGRVLASLEPVRAPRTDAAPALDVVRQRVTGALAILTDTVLGAWAMPATQPPTYAAYQELSDALLLYLGARPGTRADLPAEVRSHLARAAALDTGYLQPRLWLAWYDIVWFYRGAEADSLLRPLEAARDRLSPFENAFVDAVRTTVAGDVASAPDAWKRVAEVAPLRDFRERHVRSLLAANRPREALAALARLGPGHGDEVAEHWWTVAAIRHYLGEHDAELAAARAYRPPGPANPFALLNEAIALAALGRTEELDRRVDEALAMPAAPRAGLALGDVETAAALELRAHGRSDAGARMLDRALAWYAAHRPAGDDAAESDASFEYIALYAAGRWADARRYAERRLAHAPDDVVLLGLLGRSAARLGDRATAERMADTLASLGGAGARGLHTLERARIAAALGRPERALELLRDAIAEGLVWTARAHLHADIDFEPLRTTPGFRRLLEPQG